MTISEGLPSGLLYRMLGSNELKEEGLGYPATIKSLEIRGSNRKSLEFAVVFKAEVLTLTTRISF